MDPPENSSPNLLTWSRSQEIKKFLQQTSESEDFLLKLQLKDCTKFQLIARSKFDIIFPPLAPMTEDCESTCDKPIELNISEEAFAIALAAYYLPKFMGIYYEDKKLKVRLAPREKQVTILAELDAFDVPQNVIQVVLDKLPFNFENSLTRLQTKIEILLEEININDEKKEEILSLYEKIFGYLLTLDEKDSSIDNALILIKQKNMSHLFPYQSSHLGTRSILVKLIKEQKKFCWLFLSLYLQKMRYPASSKFEYYYHISGSRNLHFKNGKIMAKKGIYGAFEQEAHDFNEVFKILGSCIKESNSGLGYKLVPKYDYKEFGINIIIKIKK